MPQSSSLNILGIQCSHIHTNDKKWCMESHCVPTGPQMLSQGVPGWTISCPSISLPGPSHPNLAPCLMTPSSTLSNKILLKFPWTALPLPFCLEKPGQRCIVIPHSVMGTVPASLMDDQYKDTRLFFQKGPALGVFCSLFTTLKSLVSISFNVCF